jgi:hypothetical protein
MSGAGHRLLELFRSEMNGSHQPSRLSREGFTISAFSESAEGYSLPAKRQVFVRVGRLRHEDVTTEIAKRRAQYSESQP